jgi:ATP-dependent RNA helicase DDX21
MCGAIKHSLRRESTFIQSVVQMRYETLLIDRALVYYVFANLWPGQVGEEFEATAPPSLKSVCIYGGAPYRPQEEALRRGVSVVVGTPGRVLDHIERRTLKLSGLKFFILDEADQMLDMGFKDDIQKVCDGIGAGERQMLLFSATLPPWVTKVATAYMRQDRLQRVDLVEGEDQKASTDVRHIAIPCHW